MICLGVSNSVECNRFIDQVIESRRSIRKFKSETPSRGLVELVLQAGLLAPYAGASVSREDFRRFVVIPRESSATGQIAALLKRKAESSGKQLELQMQHDEFARQRGGAFLELLKMMGEYGAPNVGKAHITLWWLNSEGFHRWNSYLLLMFLRICGLKLLRWG